MNKKNYHHKDLKNELIKEGAALLARTGFEDFSLRQLAKTLDVSHAAPYRHFKNKEELVTAIVEKGYNRFYDYLYSSVQKYPDDPLNQLREMGKQYILFSVKNADLAKVLFFNPQNREPVERVRTKDSFQLLLNVVTACRDKGFIEVSDVRLASVVIWGQVHGLSALLIEKNIPFEGKLDDFVEILINGVFELIINRPIVDI